MERIIEKDIQTNGMSFTRFTKPTTWRDLVTFLKEQTEYHGNVFCHDVSMLLQYNHGEIYERIDPDLMDKEIELIYVCRYGESKDYMIRFKNNTLYEEI